MPKSRTLLPLPPATTSGLAPLGAGLSLSGTDHLTKTQLRVIEEWRTQALVIAANDAKARLAMDHLRRVHEHAEVTFDAAAGTILAVKERGGRSELHQRYVDEFSARNMELLGSHLLGTVAVAAHEIGTEVARSLYPEPEERRGLFKRLFG
jgi:hypothetical protein